MKDWAAPRPPQLGHSPPNGSNDGGLYAGYETPNTNYVGNAGRAYETFPARNSGEVYAEIPEVDAPYEEMPLPTYNESYVDVAAEGANQRDAYRPYYPTYEWDC